MIKTDSAHQRIELVDSMRYSVWLKSGESPVWFREPESTFDNLAGAWQAVEDLQDIWPALIYEIRVIDETGEELA